MNIERFARTGLVLAALVAASTPLPAQTPATEYDGAAGLGLALRRLGATQRVLMIAAHPDDENTAVLSTLALGRGADVAYLSLTRGDGGQNGIGPELGEAIGVIRSEELLAARRLDGARQFFTRAYDYGFSKSADEAFRHWPKDSVLADVVAVIRRFRPDVIVAVFSGTPRDGHGQHQASGILAREAFAAAGDPSRFPEQLAQGLRPHRPAKLYQSLWRGTTEGATLLEAGTYDPLLGRSHYQIAMASRSRHRSQDMGQAQPPGPRPIAFQRVDATVPVESSIFAGIDTTLAQRARTLAPESVRREVVEALEAYDAAALALRAGFNALAPDALVPELARALGHLDRAEARLAAATAGAGAGTGTAATANARAGSAFVADPVAELRFHIAAERADLHDALARAAGIVFDVVASDERVVPGQVFELELTLWNGGARPVTVTALEPVLPAGWEAVPADPAAGDRLAAGTPLAPGALVTRAFRVRVPADAPPSMPYYLRAPRDGDFFRWPDDPTLRGLPFEPASTRATARVEVEGAALPLEGEALFRAVSSTDGEYRRPVRVVPAVGVTLDPHVAILPAATTEVGTANAANGAAKAAATGTSARSAGASRRAATADGARGSGSAAARRLHFTVRLTHEAPEATAGTLRLELPPGWRAEPEAIPVRFAEPGEHRVFEFAVTPPDATPAGDFPVRAVFTAENGARYDLGAQVVDYPHIRPRALYRDAAATVRAVDVRVPAGLRVAYIMGAGDLVPDALAQLGIHAELLDPAALAAADLDAYDVIVVGIRAYEHRNDLAGQNRRLLEYVERGGTLIVQYNQYRFSQGGFAPYPLEIARPHDRVTDEEAPVRLLEPDHPALSWPNRIGPADFEGWIQERGLYFPRTWDERYTPLLEMADPGEEPLRGGLIVARYGKGTYVYTGLAFFRQLPAGVPGAYRLFANLLSLGARR